MASLRIHYSGASLVAQMVKNLPAMQETRVRFPWRREWLPTPVFLAGDSMSRGAWWAMVRGVPKNQPWLDSHTHLQAHMHVCVHHLCTHVHLVLQACYWVMPKPTVVWAGETGELRDPFVCSISSCRFHLPSTLNTKTLGSSLEVTIYASVPCSIGHQDLGEELKSVQWASFLRVRSQQQDWGCPGCQPS